MNWSWQNRKSDACRETDWCDRLYAYLECYSNSFCGSLMDKNAVPAFRVVGFEVHSNSLMRQYGIVEEELLRLIGL